MKTHSFIDVKFFNTARVEELVRYCELFQHWKSKEAHSFIGVK